MLMSKLFSPEGQAAPQASLMLDIITSFPSRCSGVWERALFFMGSKLCDEQRIRQDLVFRPTALGVLKGRGDVGRLTSMTCST